ncbi:ras GTPase-activating protein-binding protein 2 isoform X2 [Nymphalis io]|uniref:ras GTPase-activating protein-binding protein 2 isoform X1 n=1 Tax=Inachis io TaxID=171585 RepID=UPI00216A65E6|nr:ras GTPase-activating protein-binding protein 2 isoform X1 [Nymphalis io]XP_050349014.1 ras GTPase-activating protein-binding protein 2 isoform X1 [Nymphalis io]XP_050349015.1 ras GTPase-activating protein-binding protein 2 isoform X2 [Nymphalis io]
MVMEASPSPQSVGREFVRQYYTLLNKAPAHLHRFYNNYSSFVHGGLDAPNRETLPVVGQKQIHNRIQQLNFRDCHAKISQVDAQATLGNGVVVQVTGELSNGGAPMRRFTQTFVLAAQSPKKYYVHNDIFRYQDIVFSDEEGEGSGRSEGEEEEGAATGGYFPPAPAFPPAPFPAPPAPPHAPLLSPPAPPAPSAPLAPPAPPAPHLNGHPPPHDEPPRHLVAALQANAIPGGAPSATPTAVSAAPAPERELEAVPEPLPQPEPEREPSPPPQPSTPKTYANLLKSGASRGSPPAPAPAPAPVPAPAPASAPAPHEPRPRPPRVAQPQQPGNPSESGRRYSDAQQLFLGNLPHSATEEELRALFARFGTVAELRVHSKPAAPGAPRHPNYGFITYESAQAAAECLNAAPLFFPAEGEGAGAGVKLNVEEKKTRAREAPRRRPLSSHRAAFQPRQPYRR